MNINKIVTKITTYLCITGVVLVNNAAAVSAYEAHMINVTATIIDNGVSINLDGGKYCNDGKLKIELTPKVEGADIFYTTNGSEPRCGEGKKYSGAFTLLSSATVNAIACYEGKEGPVTSEHFDVSGDYCQTSLKINKVYYYADVNHGGASCDNENEWLEIYNPTKDDVNVNGWSVCNSEGCDIIASRDLSIPAKGFAVIAYKENTWNYWNIPDDAIKINLASVIGANGLGNTADMVALRNAAGETIDEMNWGTGNSRWDNYDSGVWNAGVSANAQGKILGRVTNGYDTDRASDWKVYDLPKVSVNYPNGGESWIVGKTYTIRWTATNPNGDNSDLGIDIYFSTDSGRTWANIAKNVTNDGEYQWRLPLAIKDGGSNYFTASKKARIKVVATDCGHNFMLTGKDISDKDFCPPIDKSLLTDEELQLLSETDSSGMTIVDSKTAAAMETADPVSPADEDTDTTEIKKNDMLNREEDEFSVDEKSGAEDDDDKSKTAANQDIPAVSDGEDADDAGQDDVSSDIPATETITVGQSADDLPITPDGDINIEFNLNS